MAKKELTYEQALARLEQIVGSLEQNETGLDDLAVKLKEAKGLLAFCKKRLQNAETEINEILKDDGQG